MVVFLLCFYMVVSYSMFTFKRRKNIEKHKVAQEYFAGQAELSFQ